MKNFFTTILYSATLFVLPAARATMLYNTIPSTQPAGLFSWPYEVEQTSEYGGLIDLTGDQPATLTSAIVGMADYALQSSWPGVGTSLGFTIPLTLNLYDVNPDQSIGFQFNSLTVSALIPWCPPTGYPDGLLLNVTFNLAGIQAPAEFIYGVAFNTQDYGASPLGVDGPYDSLNFALSTTDPTVGTNPVPLTVYLNTADSSYYTFPGPANTFRQDVGETWTGAVQFDGESATPEPSTLFLAAFSIIGLGIRKYRADARRS
jgi:hypothetical protein